MFNSKKRILLVVSLLLILLGSILAYRIQTDGGEIQVRELNIAGEDGRILSGLLFVPENATAENPAPGVLTVHGYFNSRETQSGFNIEYARRGYVVLAMDMTGHGYSEQIGGVFGDDLTRGAGCGLDYLADLPFVDADNIGLEGHSMGGWSVMAAAHFSPDELGTTVIQVGSVPGYMDMPPELTADNPYNYALVWGQYDEFARSFWGVEVPSDIVTTDKLQTAFGTTDEVEPERLYGSFAENNARKLYLPEVTHPGEHLSTAAIGAAVDFMQESIEPPNYIDPAEQIWYWKEIGTGLALVGFVLFIFSLAVILLNTSVFSSLKKSLPQNQAIKGKGWLVGAIIATAIPALTFFIFQLLGQLWFEASPIFPQQVTAGIAVWAVFNAVIALILFALWHYFSNRKKGAVLSKYGLSVVANNRGQAGKKIMKALLFAAVLAVLSHFLVSLAKWALEVDFRFWVFSFKHMDFNRFLIFLRYLPLFIIFFLVNGLILHGQFRLKEYSTEGKTMLVWMLANTAINLVGLLILIGLQLGSLFLTETLFFTMEHSELLVILGYQFILLLAFASCLSTYLFRKTGNIYVGALANGFIVTWYIVSAQAIHYTG